MPPADQTIMRLRMACEIEVQRWRSGGVGVGAGPDGHTSWQWQRAPAYWWSLAILTTHGADVASTRVADSEPGPCRPGSGCWVRVRAPACGAGGWAAAVEARTSTPSPRLGEAGNPMGWRSYGAVSMMGAL